MGRIRNYLECIIGLLVLVLLVLSFTRYKLISRFVFYELRDELILCENNENASILYEIVPELYVDNKINYYDYENYNNSFDYCNTESDTEVATSTDALLVASDTDVTTEQTEIQIDNIVENNKQENEESLETITNSNVSPIKYSYEKLCDFDFLVSNCYIVDSTTNVKQEELDAQKLLNMDMSIDLNSDDYKVLIYHTHGSETFADSREGVKEDTVIGVGDELEKQLWEKYKIKAYHDRNVYDMVDGVLDRSYAYTLSGDAVDKILKEHPSIEVIIDLHRDGVREDVRLVKTINGKPTAQIMFLNGVSRTNLNGDIDYLYNPNKLDNLGFSLQMHLAGKERYGELMRSIYIRGYSFNLNKLPRATLVEVGAQTNTVEEVKNAMEPLAYILNEVLREK